MSTPIHNEVVLGLPKNRSVAAIIARLVAIADAMDANKTMFPVPTPAITVVRSDITTLQKAQSALDNRLGTKAVRDAAQAALLTDAHNLHTYVQQQVNATPSQADVIAKSASMTLRKKAARSKTDLRSVGPCPGSVKVVAAATKGAKVLQYSTDGGKTSIDAPSTTKSSTVITGLQPGLLVHYRQRVITKDGEGAWSQTVSANRDVTARSAVASRPCRVVA